MAAFGIEQIHQVVLQFLAAHRTGYLIAGAFFGVHCAILGYLIFRSDLFPKLLGILLMIASIGYLTESFGNFLLPEYNYIYSWVVLIPATIAEVSLCLFLVIKGVINTNLPRRAKIY